MSCKTWKYVSDAKTRMNFTYNRTTSHSSVRLTLAVSRAAKENSWFLFIYLFMYLFIYLFYSEANCLWTWAAGLHSVTPCFASYPHTGSGN